MARTFRNKSTIAHGWTVRDDKRPYRLGNDRWGRDHRHEDPECRAPKYRRSLYRCETTWERRNHNGRYRAQVRNLLRVERWDDILPPHRTSGWLSW